MWIFNSYRKKTNVSMLVAAFKKQLVICRNAKHFLCFVLICFHVMYTFGNLYWTVYMFGVLSTRDTDWSVILNHFCNSLWSKIKSHPSNSWHIRHSCFDNMALHNFISMCSKLASFFFNPILHRERQNLTNSSEKIKLCPPIVRKTSVLYGFKQSCFPQALAFPVWNVRSGITKGTKLKLSREVQLKVC